MKRCPTCEIEKPLDDFHVNKRGKNGREYQCKDCKSAYHRWRADNKDKVRQYVHGGNGKKTPSWKYNIRQYGVTEKGYAEILVAQGGVCAICESPPNGRRLCIDHDHETGEVRGLLCNGCNVALGAAKDSISVLEKMIDYLKVMGTK